MATYDRRTASVEPESMLGVQHALMAKLVAKTMRNLEVGFGARNLTAKGYVITAVFDPKSEMGATTAVVSYALQDDGVVSMDVQVDWEDWLAPDPP